MNFDTKMIAPLHPEGGGIVVRLYDFRFTIYDFRFSIIIYTFAKNFVI